MVFVHDSKRVVFPQHTVHILATFSADVSNPSQTYRSLLTLYVPDVAAVKISRLHGHVFAHITCTYE